MNKKASLTARRRCFQIEIASKALSKQEMDEHEIEAKDDRKDKKKIYYRKDSVHTEFLSVL